MCVVFLTFPLQLFGVPEDEAVQEADEGEVLQRVPRVLDGAPLWRRRMFLTEQPHRREPVM